MPCPETLLGCCEDVRRRCANHVVIYAVSKDPEDVDALIVSPEAAFYPDLDLNPYTGSLVLTAVGRSTSGTIITEAGQPQVLGCSFSTGCCAAEAGFFGGEVGFGIRDGAFIRAKARVQVEGINCIVQYNLVAGVDSTTCTPQDFGALHWIELDAPGLPTPEPRLNYFTSTSIDQNCDCLAP